MPIEDRFILGGITHLCKDVRDIRSRKSEAFINRIESFILYHPPARNASVLCTGPELTKAEKTWRVWKRNQEAISFPDRATDLLAEIQDLA